ncbi:PSP1 C-terminal conserved region, putative [Trypanosoma equiperdum]|uniref:PSP1 C-terminal domain-containing protein n=2 Tax=Trypanozoon TaxID=39700 RepID=Q389H8_TRYB2|nr:hypothetical protein, conserved [Trypanosoma brucei brucei TREU927]EAN78542.1 hypothetical protein, conserved [Trypanosoma brucei brucei TREU927]SCU70362.1 PSP1 C-terminal conserved region, putative [Trypanosoma equiperdum]
MSAKLQPILESADANAPFDVPVTPIKSFSTNTIIGTEAGIRPTDGHSECRISVTAAEYGGKSHDRMVGSDSDITSAASSSGSHTGNNFHCYTNEGSGEGGGGARKLAPHLQSYEENTPTEASTAAGASPTPKGGNSDAEESSHGFRVPSCEPPSQRELSVAMDSHSGIQHKHENLLSPHDSSDFSGDDVSHRRCEEADDMQPNQGNQGKANGTGEMRGTRQNKGRPANVLRLPPTTKPSFVQVGTVRDHNLTVAIKQRVSHHAAVCARVNAVPRKMCLSSILPSFGTAMEMHSCKRQNMLFPSSTHVLPSCLPAVGKNGGCGYCSSTFAAPEDIEMRVKRGNDVDCTLHSVGGKLPTQSPMMSLSSSHLEKEPVSVCRVDNDKLDEEEELGFVVIVKGKHQCKGYLTGQSNLSAGAVVIVEGDRGEDIGTIQQVYAIEDVDQLLHMKVKMTDAAEEAGGCSSTVDDTTTGASDTPHEEAVLDSCSVARSDAQPPDDGMRLPRVLRLATSEDIAQLSALRDEETELLPNVLRVVNGFISKSTSAAGVTLVDIEFQFDKKKLTIYLRRPTETGFVNFRRMQRRFHRLLKCRIWLAYMDEVERQVEAYIEKAPLGCEVKDREPSRDRCLGAGDLIVV